MQSFFTQAIASEKAGQIDLAESLYKTVLEHSSDHVPSLYNLATLYAKKNNYSQAILYYQRATTLAPGLAAAHYNLAICWMKTQHTQEAVQCLRAAVAIDSQHAGASHLLGGILLRQGEWEEAAHWLEQAVQADPNDSASYVHWGMALWHQGQVAQAQTALLQAIALHTALPEAYYHLGVIALSAGEWDKATHYFEETIARDAHHFAAFYNLGLIKKRQQQPKLAGFFWEKAHALDPAHEGLNFLRASLGQGKALTTAPRSFVETLFDVYAPTYETHVTDGLQRNVAAHLAALYRDAGGQQMPVGWDLGCGTGLSAQQFQAYASSWVGVDVSAEMLQRARAKAIFAELHQADILYFLRAAHQPAGLIILSDVLNYVGDTTALWPLIAMHLQPGGWVAASVEVGPPGVHLSSQARFTHHPAEIVALLAAQGLSLCGQAEHCYQGSNIWFLLARRV